MTSLAPKPLATFVVLLAMATVLPTNAQEISWGSCPSVTGITAFNQTEFVSKVWYEAQRYHYLVEFGKRCIQWQFAATSTTAMTATTTMKDFFGNTRTVVGTMTQGTPVAKFAYSITQLPGLGLGIQRNHDVYILATDFSTYVVLWSCTNKFLKNEQLLWVLTSTRSPTTATLTTARAAVSSRGLDTSKLTSTSQTNCQTLGLDTGKPTSTAQSNCQIVGLVTDKPTFTPQTDCQSQRLDASQPPFTPRVDSGPSLLPG